MSSPSNEPSFAFILSKVNVCSSLVTTVLLLISVLERLNPSRLKIISCWIFLPSCLANIATTVSGVLLFQKPVLMTLFKESPCWYSNV